MKRKRTTDVLIKPVKYSSVLLFLVFLQTVRSQDMNNETGFRANDSATYAMYLQGDWDELIRLGNSMLRDGIDYPYLRTRLGTAYFYSQNYSRSVSEFDKALRMNAYDPYALLMQYYALEAVLKQTEAGSVCRKMPPSLQKQTQKSSRFRLREAHVDAGYISRQGESVMSAQQLMGNDSLYGEELLYQSGLFTDAGLLMQFYPGINLYAGIQLVNPEVHNRFAYFRSWPVTDTIISSDGFDSYYYRLDSRAIDTVYSHKIRQTSFYTQLNYAPSARVRLTVSAHLMQVKRPYTAGFLEERFWSDTAWVNTTTGEVSMIEVPLGTYSFVNKEDKFTDWSAGAEIRLHSGIITGDAGVYLTETYRQKTLQMQGGIMLMPYGNMNFYTHTRVALLHTEGANNIVFKQSAGGRLLGPVWLEASLTSGQAGRFADQSAYLVFNSPDEPQLRTEAVCTIILTNKLQLSLRHHFQNLNHKYYSYDTEKAGMTTKEYTIQTHTLTGGIKWIF